MIVLRQSTAITFRIGPFVDDGDGVTPETALSISATDIQIAKHTGAFANKNDATGSTHDSSGFYTCVFNATDTNTLGMLKLKCLEAGAAPYWERFMVMPATEYDVLFGTNSLTVDLNAGQGPRSTGQFRGFIRQGTDVTLPIGPFTSTNGIDLATGLTITAAEVEIRKAGGAFAAKNEASAAAHDADGIYDALLNEIDTDTAGQFQLKVNDAAAVIVLHEYIVMPQHQYDSLLGTGLEALLIQSGGFSAAAYLLKRR